MRVQFLAWRQKMDVINGMVYVVLYYTPVEDEIYICKGVF
jgi:hypothetical protein